MPQQNQADGVRLHNAWARLLQLQGEPANGLQHRWQAKLLAQELQDVNLMIKTTHNLGIHYYRMGQCEEGLEYLHKSKALAIKAGNRKSEGACDARIGACYFKIEEYKEAIPYYRMSYDLFTATTTWVKS
jgi:tetratricopeptide (TPR) repeat protein